MCNVNYCESMKNFIKNGEIGESIPPGDDYLVVYRSDKRSIGEIQKQDGFVPGIASRETAGNAIEEYINQIKVLERPFVDSFVNDWTAPADGPLIKENGYMIGVCCGFAGGQKGGYDYSISLPEKLYLLERVNGTMTKVAFYGNKKNINESSIIAMQLYRQGKDEFVFLTKVPYAWIREK